MIGYLTFKVDVRQLMYYVCAGKTNPKNKKTSLGKLTHGPELLDNWAPHFLNVGV